MEEIIVGIDIGTSKVCTLIGKINKDGHIDVLGKGMEPCSGVKKGIIVDIESTSDSIKVSLKQAETIANLKVGSAYVNIFGAHVEVIKNRNSVDISSQNREITEEDVEKVLYSVKDVPVPEDMQIIDIVPRQYIIDGYDEIIDPVGMVGSKLEVETDIIAGKMTSVKNIVKSMERAGIKTDGLVAECFSSGELLLSPDEKQMGVVLIDVGGGVTNISAYKNKRLAFYDSIPVGGDHITNDISIGLKIPFAEAERIKRQYELALTSLIKNDQEITVSKLNEDKKKTVKVSEVVEIIEARVYEIFSLCKDKLESLEIQDCFNAGIVLTGAGVSYVDGGIQLAYEVFDVPVRIASYKVGIVTKPEYATSMGIVKYISTLGKENNVGSEVKKNKPKNTSKKSGIFSKISKFFHDFF